MAVGTATVDGLISGLKTSEIISKLLEIEKAPLRILEAQRAARLNQQTAYSALSAKLLALRATAASLTAPGALAPQAVSVNHPELLLATAGSAAESGSHEIVVQTLAQAHKIRSGSFTGPSAALQLSGDLVLNGVTVHVAAEDTLLSLRNLINHAGAGVSASLLTVSNSDYRLVLTAEQTGATHALDLVDANESDLLQSLGLVTSATSVKHAITNGAGSDLLADRSTAVGALRGLADAPAATVQVNGTDVAVNLATDSLEDIAAAINAAAGDGTAEVVGLQQDGRTEYQLQILGHGDIPTFGDASNVLVTLGVLQKGIAHEVAAARDAQLTVDGITVQRATNTITDVVEGFTLHALSADPNTTVTVQVTPDRAAAGKLVTDFVNQYNAVMSAVHDQLSYDPDTKRSGALFGSYTVMAIQDALQRLVSQTVQAPSGAPRALSQIGITTDSRGKLQVDAARLEEALQNPANVARLLGTTATATDPEVEFSSASAKTQASPAAGYAVTITTPATKATVLGNDLSGGLAQDETLTINGTAIVSLASGTTAAEAAEQINAVLQAQGLAAQATVENGRLRLTADQFGSAHVLRVSSTLTRGTPGSTGLGAEAAEEVAEYAGTDVAGTIGGEAATGRGQYLTGDEHNAHTAGLVLRVTATVAGDQGVVYLTKGAATRLADYANLVTDATSGAVSSAQQKLGEDLKALQEREDRVNAAVAQAQERYQRQFAQLEATLARLQTQSDRLTQQLESFTLGQQRYGTR